MTFAPNEINITSYSAVTAEVLFFDETVPAARVPTVTITNIVQESVPISETFFGLKEEQPWE